MSKRKRR